MTEGFKVEHCWADLVRCECQNGEVIWTRPQHRESVEASPTAIISNPMTDDGGYNKLYWAKG